MIDLTGKVAAVTGAAGGIGAEVARTPAQAGARVVLGDVQAERGEQVAQQIRDAGGQAQFITHDTSSEARCIAFIDTAPNSFDGLDILVNNAGIEQTSFLENITDPDFVAAVTAFTPMARVAEAGEIKGTALYLASQASSFTTGLMLVTDGGCMAK